MPKGRSGPNYDILEYALRHLVRERDEIQAKIDHVQSQLGGSVRNPPAAASGEPQASQGRAKRVLSAAARKRIAVAQKRRWAEHRKAKAKDAG